MTLNTLKEILIQEQFLNNGYRPIDDLYELAVKKKETVEDYSVLYKYLEDKGAFDVVDSGEIDVEEEVYYVIDPELNKQIPKKNDSDPDTIVILLQTKKGQIIGSLDSKHHSGEFEGLERLITEIENDYNLNGDLKGESLYKYDKKTTRVALLMYNYSYAQDYKPLSALIQDKTDFPYIAIGRRGQLTTNNSNVDDKIKYNKIKVVEGAVYVLTPLKNGEFVPKEIKLNSFKNFNLKDVNVSSTDFFTGLSGAVNSIVTLTTNDMSEISKIKNNLQKYLYVEDLGIFYNQNSNSISLSRVSRDNNGVLVKDDKGKIKLVDKKIIKLDENAQNNILKTLQELNFKFQIDLHQLQDSKYRESVINAGLLSTNLRNLENEGSWFLLDYYDEEGNYQKVTIFGEEELSNFKGVTTPIVKKEEDRREDINIEESIINTIENTSVNNNKPAHETLNKINKNQNKVQGRSEDSQYYLIQEDDGEIYEYQRVSNVINPADYTAIKITLQGFGTDIKAANKYLEELEKNYEITIPADLKDLSKFENRNKIIELIKKNPYTKASRDAFVRGSLVDTIVRDFFMNQELDKPDGISKDAYISLIGRLQSIKEEIEVRGEEFYTNNIVLFHKYTDDTRIAGEVDILSVDKEGNFNIYDIKTSKNSFSNSIGLSLFDWTLRGKQLTRKEVQEEVNKFKNPFVLPEKSTKDKYTDQLSAYKNLFESQYGVPIKKLAIIPFVNTPEYSTSTGNNTNITGIIPEEGITITYNPTVAVRKEDYIEEGNIPEKVNITTQQALGESSLNKDINSVQSEELEPFSSSDTTIDNLNDYSNLLFDPEEEGSIYFSKVKEPSIEKIDIEKEVEWLKRVLPQYTEQDRLQIIEDYIKIVESSEFAEGSYHRNIITLSKLATPGTMYHEAFHGVFGSILSEKEQQKILEEAKKQFGDKTNLLLEEDLAEAFREYVLTGNKPTLGQRIVNFFKRLFNLTSSQEQLSPYLSNLFYKINQGKYAKKTVTQASDKGKKITRYSKINKRPFSEELLVDREYKKAKDIVTNLNKKRYNTESEAYYALNNSGISTAFYHPRVGVFMGKEGQGYKIQIMNNEMFENTREDILEQEEIMQELNRKNNERNFDSYSPEKQMAAMNKGWTKEKFDAIKSQ